MSTLEFHDSEIDVDAIMATIRERIASRAQAPLPPEPAPGPAGDGPSPKPLRHLDDPIRIALDEADRMKVIYQLSLDEPSRVKRAMKRLVRGVVDTPLFRFLTIKQVVVNQAIIQAVNSLHEKVQALDTCALKAQETMDKVRSELRDGIDRNEQLLKALERASDERMTALERASEERHLDLNRRVARHDERIGALEKVGEERHLDLDKRVARHDERLGALEKVGDERQLDLDKRIVKHDERLGALEKVGDERHLDLDKRIVKHDERLGALEKVGDERHLDLDKRVARHDERLGALEEASEERHLNLDGRINLHEERLGALEEAAEERHLDLDKRIVKHDKLLEAIEKTERGRHAELLERIVGNDERQDATVRTLKLVERDQQIFKRRLERFLHLLKEEQDLEPMAHETVKQLGDLTLALAIDKYGGSREERRKIHENYLPDLKALPQEILEHPVLDLGSGRGEFVEILQQHGFQVSGFEQNNLLVQECQSRGLPVRQGDALDVLRGLADESVGAITALQVIEHLERPRIWEFVKLCFDKLVRNGLLIIESINPESIISAIITFNRDFTHTYLLHPDTMQFLMEHSGFTDVDIRLLNPYESVDLLQLIPGSIPMDHVDVLNRNFKRINEVLFGYRDYAVIGRK